MRQEAIVYVNGNPVCARPPNKIGEYAELGDVTRKSFIFLSFCIIFHHFIYSIVKDSSADLGVNFKIVQNRPTVKAVCTKISKIFFCIFVNIFIFLRENKEVSFFIF